MDGTRFPQWLMNCNPTTSESGVQLVGIGWGDELRRRLAAVLAEAKGLPERSRDDVDAVVRAVVVDAEHLEVARRLHPLLEVLVGVEVQAERLLDVLGVPLVDLGELDIGVVQLGL